MPYIFNVAGYALLILSAPGADKTIMLLELARTLLACVEETLGQPIPAILNPASWAKRQLSHNRPLLNGMVAEQYSYFRPGRGICL
ncbi:MAG: hypothetical protein GY801_32735 [bacterium]|nr:hypothetical protein [bacterium]